MLASFLGQGTMNHRIVKQIRGVKGNECQRVYNSARKKRMQTRNEAKTLGASRR